MAPIPRIDSLTDEELRTALIEYGVNVGPVVPTTRKVFERKLQKLIDSAGETPSAEEEEEDDEEEENDEQVEDEEVIISQRRPVVQTSAPVMPKPTYSTPRATAPSQRVYTPVPSTSTPTQRTPIIQARKADPTKAVRRNVTSGTSTSAPTLSRATTSDQQVKKGGGLGMWIKLLFILFVALLVYLVVLNMNPSVENNIPESLEGN